GTADRNRSHWSTSKTPSYTKSVSWQHHLACNLNRSPVNISIIELIIFTLFVFPLTIILFRALSHGNSIVFINFG
ncbi:hypothetical protein SM919_23110, partial [Escherichia coli]|nr:hypothetical protein [Escherichia coli]